LIARYKGETDFCLRRVDHFRYHLKKGREKKGCSEKLKGGRRYSTRKNYVAWFIRIKANHVGGEGGDRSETIIPKRRSSRIVFIRRWASHRTLKEKNPLLVKKEQTLLQSRIRRPT